MNPPGISSFASRVARRIAASRVAQGLTQEALAQRLGIATKNLQRIESGRQNLTLRTLDGVATALGCDAGDLIGRETVAARAPLAALTRAGIEVIDADASPPEGAVAVFSLSAAAGFLAGDVSVERLGWVVVRDLPPGEAKRHFVVRAVGHSMEPLVPNGSWCLFRGDVTGPIEGRVVLIQLRHLRDPDTEGAYAIKRLGGVEVTAKGIAVRLESLNPEYQPYVVRLNALSELCAIAEFVRVIVPRRRGAAQPGALTRRGPTPR